MLQHLLPARCGACGVAGPSPCGPCIEEMAVPRPGPPPHGIDWCRAAVVYQGPARRIVAGLKYRNGRPAVAWMAEALQQLLAREDLHRIDVITWIPSAPAHRRQRGFDQGRLLAAALGRRSLIPVRELLTRGLGPPQTGQSLSARRSQPPQVSSVPLPSGLQVLVVDDVWTTGASLSAAAHALRLAGAAGVKAVTVARTPLKAAAQSTEAHWDGNGEIDPSHDSDEIRARTPRARAGTGGTGPAA